MTSEIPARVGPYVIESVIGRGGMGIVYRATAPDGSSVALKMLRSDAPPEVAVRMAREADFAIDHEHVVRLLDAAVDDEAPYLVLELLEGETMAERIAKGPVAAEEARRIGVGAAQGLSAVHAAGMIHRDIKPSNVFLCDDGGVKLLDFGIARRHESFSDTRLTATGQALGTVGYLPPEQAAGGDADARGDVWSLGVVLYESITGKRLFDRETAVETLVATILEDIEPLARVAPTTPGGLTAAIDRAVTRQAERRWPDAQSFAAALHDDSLDGAAIRFARDERRIVAVVRLSGLADVSAVEALSRREECALVPGKDPDEALLVFGAERWVGDELERAIRAAVELRSAASRVAVASGRAAAGATGLVGAVLRAVDTAAAVDVAGISVHADAARALSTDALTPISEEVFELPLDAELGEQPRGGQTFGRIAELARLGDMHQRCDSDRRAHAMLLCGPVGVGKTHLLHVMREQLEDRAVVLRSARAPQHLSGRSLGLLEEMFPAVKKFVAETEDGDDVDPQLVLDRARLCVEDILEELTSDEVCAVVIDDLHRADDASLQILDEVVSWCAERPLLLLATTRPELFEERPELFRSAERVRIDLGGLSRPDSDSLAQGVAGEPLPADLSKALFETTAGNPFFLQEMVRGLVARRGDDGTWPPPDRLPVSVEAAVQSRLDALGGVERDACLSLAVCDRPFLVAAAEALGVSPAALVLSSLERSDVVRRRGRGMYGFTHPLVSRVAYEMLKPARRSELHGRAADFLQSRSDSDAEDVARHLELAGRAPAAAARYVSAALAASRRGDAAAVLRCSARALELGPPADLVFRLRAIRVDALRFFGRRSTLEAELELAAASARTEPEQATIMSERAVVLARKGVSDEALALAEEAVRLADQSEDDATRALCNGRAFIALLQIGRVEDAQRRLVQASRFSAGAGSALRARVLEWEAYAGALTGDLGEMRRTYSALIDLYGRSGDQRRLAGAEANLADIHNRVGNYEAAAKALRSALRRCERVGHRTMAAYTHLNLSHSLVMQGAATEAGSHLDAAGSYAAEANERRLALLVDVYRARALLSQARPKEALELAERAAAGARQAGIAGIRVNALAAAALAQLRNAQPDAALELAEQAMLLRDELGSVEEHEDELFVAHAEILEALDREDDAAVVRRKGADRLLAIASGISDPELRRLFVENQPLLAGLDERD